MNASCFVTQASTRASTRAFTLVVGLAAAAVIGVLGCASERTETIKQPRPVRYAKITAGSESGNKSFSAAIQAGDATQLSFRVGGTLTRVAFKRGDRVEKDALIAVLDDTDFRVQLAQASAQRDSARTRRDAARTTLARVEKLYESNSAALSEYQNAKTQMRTAESDLAATGQQVAAARNQLKYTELKAPFAGVLQSVSGNPGEAVGAGRVIAVLSKGDELEVKASVPEAFIARVSAGAPVSVKVTALGARSLKGTVSEVAFASEGAAAYPVIVTLDEDDAAIRPGMAAMVTFDFDTGPARLRVPVSAVGNEESGDFVYVLEPVVQGAASQSENPATDENRANQTYSVRKQSVSLGSLTGEYFAVEDGLQEGSLVATAGLSVLLDGMTVRLFQPGEK